MTLKSKSNEYKNTNQIKSSHKERFQRRINVNTFNSPLQKECSNTQELYKIPEICIFFDAVTF